MGIFCKICQITVQNENSWNFHIYGKKHVLAMQAQQVRQAMAERSVFVTGFEPGTTTQRELSDYFMKFGNVMKVILNERGKFAFVEYHDKDCIPLVLSRKHNLGRRSLLVKPRHLKPLSPRRQTEDKIKQSEDEKQNEINEKKLLIDNLIRGASICHQMEILQNQLQMTEAEREFRLYICGELASIFRQHFEFFELHLFGSSMTGLGFHNSDLDVVLSLFPEGTTSVGNQDLDTDSADMSELNSLNEIIKTQKRKIKTDDLKRTPMKNILKFVKKLLVAKGHYPNIFIIPAKSAPLIRFNVNRELICDLSIKNKMAKYNSELIKFYLKLDKRILLLMLSIKYWIKTQDLGGSGSHRLTSYALIMLIIFFLQNISPPLLPTVESLQILNATEERMLDGWRCDFCEDMNKVPKSVNGEKSGDLMRKFFQFYSKYDFASYIISPFSGKSVLKSNNTNLPSNFKISFICVQDPFELSRNLAANVIDRTAVLIIQGFSQADALLSESCSPSSKTDQPWGLALILDKKALNEANVHQKPNTKLISTTDQGKSFLITFDHPNFIKTNINADEGRKNFITKMYDAVIVLLSKALLFECSKLSIDKENDSETTQERRSLKRPAEGSKELKSSKKFIGENGIKLSLTTVGNNSDSDDNIDCVSNDDEIQTYLCKIQHRVWIGRKKMKQVLSSQLPAPVLQAEELVSKSLIKNDPKTNCPPLACSYSFVCRLSPSNQSEQLSIKVNLTPVDSSAELKGVVFDFLQSYLPKVVDRYLLEGN